MFKNEKYATVGINHDIDFLLQVYLWNLIDKLGEFMPLDYLQVFEIEAYERDGKLLQKIIHIQEVPPYRKQYLLESINPSSAKIFVIDDEDHSTMLLAEEY